MENNVRQKIREVQRSFRKYRRLMMVSMRRDDRTFDGLHAINKPTRKNNDYWT